MLDQSLDLIDPTPLKPIHLDTCHISHRERDEAYVGIIIQFAPRWRLILCKNYIQWIIQKKESSHRGLWRGKQYLTRKESVFKACVRLGLLSASETAAILEALPEYARQSNKK